MIYHLSNNKEIQKIDNLLKSIAEGKLPDEEYYTYLTNDIKEKQICHFLNREKYIRLNRDSDGYYCHITENGKLFLYNGGYKKLYHKRLIKKTIKLLIQLIVPIASIIAIIKSCS